MNKIPLFFHDTISFYGMFVYTRHRKPALGAYIFRPVAGRTYTVPMRAIVASMPIVHPQLSLKISERIGTPLSDSTLHARLLWRYWQTTFLHRCSLSWIASLLSLGERFSGQGRPSFCARSQISSAIGLR